VIPERAFVELRPAMFALAYRITGNRADAEEIVQDAFMQLHKTEPDAAVRSLKAYLTTITARLSLNRLRDQRARRESYVGEWLPEPLLTTDEPGVRAEDVSFALLAMLERLSPLERVVFVLRNAFDFSFEEIAPVAQREVAACRKIFSRARTRVQQERPRFTVDPERHRAVLRNFAEAARGGDMARLVSLLDDGVELHTDGGGKALATKRPVVGSNAVAQFIMAMAARRLTSTTNVTFEETTLNGAPALVLKAAGDVVVAILIDTDGEHIHSIFAVANPDKLDTLKLSIQ